MKQIVTLAALSVLCSYPLPHKALADPSTSSVDAASDPSPRKQPSAGCPDPTRAVAATAKAQPEDSQKTLPSARRSQKVVTRPPAPAAEQAKLAAASLQNVVARPASPLATDQSRSLAANLQKVVARSTPELITDVSKLPPLSTKILGAGILNESGISDDSIFIGQSAALTGPAAINGIEFTAGVKPYFDKVNREGGVHGRKLVLITLDDEYKTPRTLENLKSLIFSHRVFVLFGIQGTDNVIEGLKIATPNKVPFLFPVAQDHSIRTTFNRYLFTAAASGDEEIEGIIEHQTSIGVTRIGVAHLTNGLGTTLLSAADRAMVSRGFKLAAVVPFDVSGKDAALAAQKMSQVEPQAVIVAAIGRPAAAFIQAYQATRVGSQILVFSGVGTELILKTLGEETSRSIIVSQVLPYPWSNSMPLVRDYLALKGALKDVGTDVTKITYMNFRGYVSARILVEALKRSGRILTREGLVDALERMGQVEIGGFPLLFSPRNHHGSRYVEMTMIGREGKLIK